MQNPVAPSSETPRGQAYVVNSYSLIGFFALAVFGAMHAFIEHNVALGVLELVGAAMLMVNVLFLQATHNVVIARTGYLLVVLALLIVMLVTGGTQNTGIFWYFMFPVSAFFLTGKRQGMWWMAALFAATLAVASLAQLDVINIPYSFIDIRQLLVTVSVAAFGIYLYVRSRESLVVQTSNSQNALRQEMILADTVLQNIDEGIITTDAQGRVLMLNKSVETMLGWKSEELIGKKFVDYVPLADEHGKPIPDEDRPISQALRRHEAVTRTCTFGRKDGSTFPAAAVGRPVIVDGVVRGAVETVRDVTREQAIDRAKSEFVTLASHQLRTPISSIGWASELLLSGDAGILHSTQREYIQQIYDSNHRSATMVEAMLLVSSLELGSFNVRPETTDLAAVAHRLFEQQVSMLPKGKKLDASEHYDPAVPKLQLDPKLTKALLGNLISNAFKYTPSGGNVSVTIAPSFEKLTPRSKGSVTIAVADTGYGIPAAQQQKIFVKLFRASNIKTKDTDGTGLGLYVIKKILDQVGGRISFVSHEGEGSAFTIVLPLEGMPRTVGTAEHRPKVKTHV